MKDEAKQLATASFGDLLLKTVGEAYIAQVWFLQLLMKRLDDEL